MAIKEGTLVSVYSVDGENHYFFTLKKDEFLSTHKGIIHHNLLMENDFGNIINTHKEVPFVLQRPSLWDILMKAKRHTQIIYPKDIGYILLKLGVRSGDRVIEAGTGSGVLSTALAFSLLPDGKLYTYEKREEFSKKAQENLNNVGLLPYVEMAVADIGSEGFAQSDVDAVFLDMKDPLPAIIQAKKALKAGGMLGFLLPTTNQICDVIKVLEEENFMNIEALELLERKFKINPYRPRPEDRMVAHTAYLLFARKSYAFEKAAISTPPKEAEE